MGRPRTQPIKWAGRPWEFKFRSRAEQAAFYLHYRRDTTRAVAWLAACAGIGLLAIPTITDDDRPWSSLAPGLPWISAAMLSLGAWTALRQPRWLLRHYDSSCAIGLLLVCATVLVSLRASHGNALGAAYPLLALVGYAVARLKFGVAICVGALISLGHLLLAPTQRPLDITVPANMPAQILGINLVGLFLLCLTESRERALYRHARQLRRQRAALERLAERADRRSAARTKFVAAATHDLRQPLHALTLLGDTLAGTIKDPLQRRLIEQLRGTSASLRALVENVLDAARLDVEAVQPKIQVFALDRLIERLADEFRPTASAQGLALLAQCEPTFVRSDPLLVERVLRNLLSNAIRFTPAGHVLVRIERGTDQRVSVVVADTGIGVQRDAQELIFDAFYQVAGSDAARSGFGLGLAIVRQIDRLLGLQLVLHSEPSSGSQFRFQLPRAGHIEQGAHRAETTGVANRAGEAPAAAARHGHVVVVDDSLVVRRALQLQIEHWGYDAVALGSAAEFRDAGYGVLEDCAVLILDDALGNDASGFDLAHEALERGFPRERLIMITGQAQRDRFAQYRAAQFRYFEKPLDSNRLRKLIEHSMQP